MFEWVDRWNLAVADPEFLSWGEWATTPNGRGNTYVLFFLKTTCKWGNWLHNVVEQSEKTLAKECIPVGCVPLARNRTEDPPEQRTLWSETPLDRDLPWTETPLDWDPQDRDPSIPGRQTNTCENITFAKFVGGKKNVHTPTHTQTHAHSHTRTFVMVSQTVSVFIRLCILYNFRI